MLWSSRQAGAEVGYCLAASDLPLPVMAGSERLRPKPYGPLPAPEPYESESYGPKPERPGLVVIGTLIEPIPVTRLAANFSPTPRMAPPPLGREMAGAEIWLLSKAASQEPPSLLLPPCRWLSNINTSLVGYCCLLPSSKLNYSLARWPAQPHSDPPPVSVGSGAIRPGY
jgi:hypothetical protein